MIKNSFFVTTILFLAIFFFLMQELRFLIPYRQLLFYEYGWTILAVSVVLFLNLLAGVFVLSRRLFLKDTGEKLAHLEKQLRSGPSISDELSRRLREEL
jgi:hypothetical protein